jgi:hypothetical protein
MPTVWEPTDRDALGEIPKVRPLRGGVPEVGGNGRVVPKLTTGTEPQLPENMTEVVFDRLFAHIQLGPNLSVGQPPSYQHGNIVLAFRESEG